MGLIVNPGTAYSEELRRWEYADTYVAGEPGLRGPRIFEEFPKMLSLAGRNADNKIAILREMVANTADEQRNLESRGYACGHDHAIEVHKARERETAKFAANRAYQERTMSPAAQAEAAAVDAEASGHVAEIPVTPVRKRGRPAKLSA